MDGKHNLHLVDSYPEPQLQPTSHIQHYLATVRWGHGRQAFQRSHCSQQEGCGRAAAVFAEVRARAGEEGCGVSFLTIFRAQMGTQNRYTRYTKIGLAWLVSQALAKVKYAKNIGKMAVCRKAAFPLRIARG